MVCNRLIQTFGGLFERLAYVEIPPRIEYRLTSKGQELVESVINLLIYFRDGYWIYY